MLKRIRKKIMNYIETYFIVKTMECILESIFFDSPINYSFSIENKNDRFIVTVNTEEELVNGKTIRNKTIKFKSFVYLILNAENIKSSITKNLIERN